MKAAGRREDDAATTVRRILDRDRTILGLAARLERAIPTTGDSDLTLRQLIVLHMLAARPRHIGEVAETLGITISSASGLVDRMVRARLVTRVHEATDRRLVSCVVTAHGSATLHEFLAIGRLRLERVLTELSRGELEIVEQALDLLIRATHTVIARNEPNGQPSALALTGA